MTVRTRRSAVAEGHDLQLNLLSGDSRLVSLVRLRRLEVVAARGHISRVNYVRARRMSYHLGAHFGISLSSWPCCVCNSTPAIGGGVSTSSYELVRARTGITYELVGTVFIPLVRARTKHGALGVWKVGAFTLERPPLSRSLKGPLARGYELVGPLFFPPQAFTARQPRGDPMRQLVTRDRSRADHEGTLFPRNKPSIDKGFEIETIPEKQAVYYPVRHGAKKKEEETRHLSTFGQKSWEIDF